MSITNISTNKCNLQIQRAGTSLVGSKPYQQFYLGKHHTSTSRGQARTKANVTSLVLQNFIIWPPENLYNSAVTGSVIFNAVCTIHHLLVGLCLDQMGTLTVYQSPVGSGAWTHQDREWTQRQGTEWQGGQGKEEKMEREGGKEKGQGSILVLVFPTSRSDSHS